MAADEPSVAPGTATKRIHGTAIARKGFAVLLCGASGVGKSDLALRALTTPVQLPGEATPSLFELVSDDQTDLHCDAGLVLASPPEAIKGLLEVRGVGIISIAYLTDKPLALIAQLTHCTIERMPEPNRQQTTMLGVQLGTIHINPRDASAPAKLALVLDCATGHQRDIIQQTS